MENNVNYNFGIIFYVFYETYYLNYLFIAEGYWIFCRKSIQYRIKYFEYVYLWTFSILALSGMLAEKVLMLTESGRGGEIKAICRNWK